MALSYTTGWQYDNSASLALSVGKTFEVTVDLARIYIKSPAGVIHKIEGAGAGGGYSLTGIPYPGGISGSGENAHRSFGTDVYSFDGKLDIDNFANLMILYAADAQITAGGIAGNLAVFLQLSIFQKVNLAASAWTPLFPIALVDALTRSVTGFCMFCGSQYNLPNLGVEGTITAYWVSHTQM